MKRPHVFGWIRPGPFAACSAGSACGLLLLVIAGAAGARRLQARRRWAVARGQRREDRRQARSGARASAWWPRIPTRKDDDELAIALEFSRPLVGTQEFDALIAVTDKDGAPVKGSWVLDDDGDDEAKVLRFPHVEASKEYVVTIRAGLTAADGDRLGKEDKRRSTPARSIRWSASPRRAACCRRARAAACRWCR